MSAFVVAAIDTRFGVAASTAVKWARRWDATGTGGLQNRGLGVRASPLLPAKSLMVLTL